MQRLFLKPNESREEAIDSCPNVGPKINIPSPNANQMSLSPQPENSRSSHRLDKAVEYELKHGRRLDPKMDKKKLRRIVSNRLSAHRARVKKAKYLDELENMASHLEDVTSILNARIESFKENRKQLLLQNESLQRLLMFRLDEAKLSEIELEKNQMEVWRLTEMEKSARGKGEISKQMVTNCYTSLKNSGYCKQEKIVGTTSNQGEAEVDQYLNLEG